MISRRFPDPRYAHDWALTPKEAIALQRELAQSLILHDVLPEIRHVAGVDIGFEADGKITRAAVAVLDAQSLEMVDHVLIRLPTSFPYIPGLLSFREAPAALEAIKALRISPDLLLVDGQGIAHPRRFGIACHLGLLTDIPAIGVAKSRLIGKHEEPPQERGAWTPLLDGSDLIGVALRSRISTKPLYISTGHRISLEKSIAWVMHCTTRFRIPETTRKAHWLASVQRD